jgi:hypothetical protein
MFRFFAPSACPKGSRRAAYDSIWQNAVNKRHCEPAKQSPRFTAKLPGKMYSFPDEEIASFLAMTVDSACHQHIMPHFLGSGLLMTASGKMQLIKRLTMMAMIDRSLFKKIFRTCLQRLAPSKYIGCYLFRGFRCAPPPADIFRSFRAKQPPVISALCPTFLGSGLQH